MESPISGKLVIFISNLEQEYILNTNTNMYKSYIGINMQMTYYFYIQETNKYIHKTQQNFLDLTISKKKRTNKLKYIGNQPFKKIS